jgi:ribosome-associated heat shock protein Hsp15
MDSVRIDKWLWAARFFKSRTQSTQACDQGQVTVNGTPARPSRLVRPGDEVRAEVRDRDRILKVLALGEKRGSAEVARTLFEDLTPPEPEPEPETIHRDRGLGRPTKRDRRKILRIFRDEED